MTHKDSSNQSHKETITPLSVHLNNRGSNSGDLRRPHRYGVIILSCTAIILAALGAWFLHYLSQNPGQPLPPAPAKPSPPPTKPAPETVAPAATLPSPGEDPEKLALAQQAAEQKLAGYLAIKNELDAKGAADWGTNAYRDMVTIGEQADGLLIEKAFEPASAAYARAAVIGRELAQRSDEALQRMLTEGGIALAEGNGADARHKFKVALMIDPANQLAQKGLKRSQTIENVLQLVAAGKQHESEGSLARAREEYLKALELDPQAEAARQSLARVTERIREEQFSQFMSSGLAAFHDKNYALAKAKLTEAKSLKPGSREVSDALMQVDEALRLARIDQLRAAAEQAEKSENWQTALESYLKALKIDQNLQFAAHGRERARQQIRIAKRLDFYLAQPQVLESDKQLKNAILLLHEARETTPSGPKLTGRIKNLETLVTAAQTPVIVTIDSDNLTHVAVYKVGRLGRFARRELKLRPGTYTVVGARDGYQDVRRKIVVKHGQPAMRITVKCKVKI
jgi:tetratricopeptide (TPR) repeat protein